MNEQPKKAPAKSIGDTIHDQVQAALAKGLHGTNFRTSSTGPMPLDYFGPIIAAQLRRDHAAGRPNSKWMVTETRTQGQGNYYAKVGTKQPSIFAEYYKSGRITWTGQPPIEFEDVTEEDLVEGAKINEDLANFHAQIAEEQEAARLAALEAAANAE